MNNTTMLGTYILDGDIPAEPEIVLSNCADTAMVGQLVSAFQSNPDIRFFLIENVDEDLLDMGADFHFIRDNGNWVLANHNTMLDVHFDDPDFNPTGNEGFFSLTRGEDGSWSLFTGDAVAATADLPPADQLLVDMGQDDIFGEEAAPMPAENNPETFFIDPSVLAHGENEILVTNFTPGHDTLELSEGLSVTNVVVDSDNDLTSIFISGADPMDDIVVKLLGVCQPDLPPHELGLAMDGNGDDIISHIISSGLQTD